MAGVPQLTGQPNLAASHRRSEATTGQNLVSLKVLHSSPKDRMLCFPCRENSERFQGAGKQNGAGQSSAWDSDFAKKTQRAG